MNKYYYFPGILLFLISMILFSCASKPEGRKNDSITLLFAGDIMAHRPNYNMKNYDKIWDDIRETVLSADIAFANLEAPVCNNLDFSPYPNFNMKENFPAAAINAGFNTFSIINNHTNDQSLDGMKATLAWANRIETETKHSDRPVVFCGINEKPNMPVSYKIIQKENWKIIFVAVTEIINRPDYRSYMNYVVASRKNWDEFAGYLAKIRAENPCDLMILSIHSDEPEYVLPVSKKRRDYYHKLTENGVDVVWANHPHIVREREIIGEKDTNLLKKVIIYGNGNVISGQRWEPDFDNPENPRDDTGDGIMMKVTFSKNKKNLVPFIEETETFFITTYINTAWEFVIKKLDDNFIQYLNDNGRKKWAEYIQKRKQITENIKETTIWQ